MPSLKNQGIARYWSKSARLMKKGEHFNFTTPYSINPVKCFVASK